MANPDNSPPLPPGLSRQSLPRHVAIIMDGNGRWAKSRGLSRVKGHEEGANSVRAVVEAARRLGLEALSLYAFSTENWSRPKAEVTALMALLSRFLKKVRAELIDKGIRLTAVGQVERLPSAVSKLLNRVMAETAHCRDMTLCLCLSYGGREELTRAARALCREAAEGKISPDEVDQDALAARLYTHGLPDPDLMIRTSGELRISNFLLWQLAYTEFYFTDLYWPDFRENEFIEALREYAERQRRFGRTGEQLE